MTLNLTILLAAIALVESGGNDAAIGRHGERSRYQITRTVWRQHMGRLPFVQCTTKPKLARQCAERHLGWLVKNGVVKTSHPLAYSWNLGLFRYNYKPINWSSYSYAVRVDNTYHRLMKEKGKR